MLPSYFVDELDEIENVLTTDSLERPELSAADYPTNIFEGLAANNLNFIKLMYYLGDSLFGQYWGDETEPFTSSTSLVYTDMIDQMFLDQGDIDTTNDANNLDCDDLFEDQDATDNYDAYTVQQAFGSIQQASVPDEEDTGFNPVCRFDNSRGAPFDFVEISV